jgi:hypothetical protein
MPSDSASKDGPSICPPAAFCSTLRTGPGAPDGESQSIKGARHRPEPLFGRPFVPRSLPLDTPNLTAPCSGKED